MEFPFCVDYSIIIMHRTSFLILCLEVWEKSWTKITIVSNCHHTKFNMENLALG